jgi:hypothetical protein
VINLHVDSGARVLQPDIVVMLIGPA